MSGVDENKKVPAIRFEGFGGNWVEDKILNISPLQRGFDLPKNKMKAGNYPVVMSNGINGYHSEYKAIGPGVVTGRSGTIGNIHFIQPNYWPHNTSLWVTSFKGNEPLYIYYMYLKLDLNRFGTGSGVPTLNRNDVHDQLFKIPKDKKEQTKIGNYFQQLDTLIAQHQQKHDKLQNLKKALLEKCFPKQGEHTPELRFKGFSGAWEEKALGEISSITIGEFVIKTKQHPNSPYPVYNGGKSHTGFYDEFNNEGNKIVISARGANAGFVNIEKGRYWAGNSCYSVGMLDNNTFYTDYIYHYIKKNQNKFTDFQQAANIPAVSKSDVETFKIEHPMFEEQTKIGNLFQQLDTLINQQQTQLGKLKNIKQACLEKMFV